MTFAIFAADTRVTQPIIGYAAARDALTREVARGRHAGLEIRRYMGGARGEWVRLSEAHRYGIVGGCPRN